MKVRLITIILAVFLLLFSTSSRVLADEVTETELNANPNLDRLNDALVDDPTNENPPAEWKCGDFARAVQAALRNLDPPIETKLVDTWYKVQGSNIVKGHTNLKTPYKVGNKDVYIEPQSDRLFKGLENAIKNGVENGRDVTISRFCIEGQQCTWVTAVPVFPNVYIGIGAALGAGVLAYILRRRLVQLG